MCSIFLSRLYVRSRKFCGIVIPARFALACRRAAVGPRYGMAGIQLFDQHIPLIGSLDAR
jgi:hypothetical protein